MFNAVTDNFTLFLRQIIIKKIDGHQIIYIKKEIRSFLNFHF